MLKTIKLVLRDKLCAVTGVSSAFVMAVFSLLSSGLLRRVGGEWTISMKPLEFLAVGVQAMLIGLVMALFVYNLSLIGVRRSKGTGFSGIVFAVFASFVGCCGAPLLSALVGVGASIFLARYAGVFLLLSIGILIFCIFFITRDTESKQVCCEPRKPRKSSLITVVCLALMIIFSTVFAYGGFETPKQGIQISAPINYTSNNLTRPIYWEEIDNDGSFTNPEHAGDNDSSTWTEIKSPSGCCSEVEIYESIAYAFKLKPEMGHYLHYKWSTQIGRGSCWDGEVKISYWNWEISRWDEIGSWEDQELSTQALYISPDYINSDLIFKVRFHSKSGCTFGERYATTIALYDIYVI